MKRFYLTICVLVLFCYGLSAQHKFDYTSDSMPSIDKCSVPMNVLGKWPILGEPNVSNNGRYVSYVIERQPVNSHTLVIQDIGGTWKKEFVNSSIVTFSDDSKLIVFEHNDSLFFLKLGSHDVEIIRDVRSFKVPSSYKKEWITYQLKNSDNLIVRNLRTGMIQLINEVGSYIIDSEARNILIKSSVANKMQVFKLTSGSLLTIWSDKQATIKSFCFDRSGNQVAFMASVVDKNGESLNSLWYYSQGMNKAIMKVIDNSEMIDSALSITGVPTFSTNGKWIYFDLMQKIETPTSDSDAVMVDIWSYKDAILQPAQMIDKAKTSQNYMAVVGSTGNSIVQLEFEHDKIVTGFDQIPGDYAVVRVNYIFKNYGYQPWWPFSVQPSYYLVSLQDGTRKLLKKETWPLYNFSFSPGNKYLVYFDWREQNYFCYNILNNTTTNVTKSIPTGVSMEYIHSVYPNAVAPIVCWSENSNEFLIYDNYDIWEVDASGQKPNKNITNGYGKRNFVKLRYIYGPEGNSRIYSYKKTDKLLLTAFDQKTKYNGFYLADLSQKKDPILLTMGPYTYYRTASQKYESSSFDDGLIPMKARDKELWLVKRQTFDEIPNYYLTQDFRIYKPLTNLKPHKDYNWLTAELMSWKMFDGQISDGVLYKPENFDPRKKYPVIINYYESLSHRLYEFPYPNYCNADINIPWFVSQGYLVFIPDIYYKVASKTDTTVGEWAYNSIVSAGKFLATLPYVNGNKMGIQGFSFGGMETSYVVTRTNIFAAAVEGAGITDYISAYLTLTPFLSPIENASRQNATENGHELFGATLWQRPDLYLKNSSVIHADKITTPLLIMHCKNDNQIQWRQGVELYLALRRLGKKGWLLQYDNGGHGVDGKEAVDYTIRMNQFFDYYLKDALPPKWMTEGLPARLKGVKTRFELDNSGTKP